MFDWSVPTDMEGATCTPALGFLWRDLIARVSNNDRAIREMILKPPLILLFSIVASASCRKLACEICNASTWTLSDSIIDPASQSAETSSIGIAYLLLTYTSPLSFDKHEGDDTRRKTAHLELGGDNTASAEHL